MDVAGEGGRNSQVASLELQVLKVFELAVEQIEDAPVSSQQPKKLPTTPDLLLAQLPSATLQPNQPILIPTALRLQLLPAKTAAKSVKEGDKNEDANQDATTPILSTPVTPPSVLPSASEVPPLSSAREESSTKNPSFSQTEVLAPIQLTATTPAKLTLVAADPVPLQPSVNSDATKPMPPAELAFAARITPIPAAHLSSPTSNSAEIHAAPKLPAAPVSTEVSSISSDAPDQQAGSDSNGSPSQFTRAAPAKPSSKLQPHTEPNLPEPTIAISPAPPAPAPLQPASPNTEPAAKAPAETTSQPTDSRPEIAALPPSSSASKTEPVRDLSIRLGNGPGNQVDVRIQERAGEVHVAVLSNSSSLNSNLREQVGDLVGKLDRAGYHAETFKVSTPAGSQASSQSNTEQDLSGRQQQQQEEARQQSSGRQKRSNQNQWLQQMNGTFGPTAIEGIDQK